LRLRLSEKGRRDYFLLLTREKSEVMGVEVSTGKRQLLESRKSTTNRKGFFRRRVHAGGGDTEWSGDSAIDVWKLRLDGSGKGLKPTYSATFRVTSFNPVVSPDGRKMVFRSGEARMLLASGGILIMDFE
jgi:Tol biopolymer transport system component